ncbi:transient receptor potential cation channel subfamily V member 6-like [Centruroides sculpturatus]|uniref:transient receptor potential cation channel subfamily V member 6-like n=1 Tax=Centruroides sculpturatus TaxID=218467 RepID=UPI000C6C96CA|nr:transient receptor potential cation channel subfamily V member 6-like [Centruroides sculpturatus]
MGNCCTDNHLNSAGALLDEIVSQPDCGLDNRLYKLIDYQKGGKLVDAYERGGSKEVECLAKKELKEYMCEDGEGMNLTYEYYNKWKHLNDDCQAVIQMEETFNSNCQVPKFTEHQICWKLEYRGLLGESILHVLILCNSKIHTRIAKVLLRLYPHLAWDIIEGEEYFGASALHLAIAYHNTDIVKQVVECGANVNQRATGRFFLPHDQQNVSAKKQTNFIGLCYLGEYPLAWAACCDNEPAYNLLLARGGDPNMQDSFGNMILHMVVIRDKLKMYGYALRHPQKPAKDCILNNYGLTPLTLACKLGRNKIFREMLDLSAIEFWRYTNITCSGYPLNALDTILPNGKTNWNSALMIILDGQTNEHLDMLDGGVIQRLLEEKWKTFARQHFLKRLVFIFLHLITLGIAVFLRPHSDQPLIGTTDVWSICRYCFEIISCLGCVIFVIFQQGQEILAQGIMGFLFSLTNPSKAVFIVSNILILACIPCRILEERYIEDCFLSIALPGTWFFLIFFAGAMRLTGPFITMIYSMLVGDMFRFSIIYVIFLLGFTQAFFFLFKSSKNERFESFPQTWMSLFHMTLGFYEYGDLGQTYYHMMTRLVFVSFMVIMPILLLNMLIAMMGNTYCKVIIQSEREWMRQWAKIVVALERAIDQKRAKEFLESYSISLDSGNDSTMEQRAVMVIKSKAKTKAKQRKGALMNWKRIGKKIVQEIRQCGGTADGVHQKFHTQANLLAPKFHYAIRSDESENEAVGTPIVKDGLGDALHQLVFAHDLDISLSAATPPPSSPSRLETNASEEADKPTLDNGNGKDNEAFVNDVKDEIIEDKSRVLIADLTNSEFNTAVCDFKMEIAKKDLAKIKLKKHHQRKLLLHRTKIGIIEEDVEEESRIQNAENTELRVLSDVKPKRKLTSAFRRSLKNRRRKQVEYGSSDTDSLQNNLTENHITKHKRKCRKHKCQKSLKSEMVTRNITENHTQVKADLAPWSTENVVAMTSIVHWDDELQMF